MTDRPTDRLNGLLLERMTSYMYLLLERMASYVLLERMASYLLLERMTSYLFLERMPSYLLLERMTSYLGFKKKCGIDSNRVVSHTCTKMYNMNL